MTNIVQLLGEEAVYLLDHRCVGIPKESLYVPGPDYVDRVVAMKDRKTGVLRSLQALYGQGRLANTGYLSLLPVDQGVEHSGGASFAPNPMYFDPENIVKLAIEGGCNGVASTLGVLGSVARRYAHKIPFIVKINHNEMLTYPNIYDQTLFASVDQAFDMGAVAVGATIFYGSEHSRRQIQEVSDAFEHAHSLGMATILWAYLRNPAFKTADKDYHVASDLTGQANHLAVTINADIVKQKMAENNGGFEAIKVHWLSTVHSKFTPEQFKILYKLGIIKKPERVGKTTLKDLPASLMRFAADFKDRLDPKDIETLKIIADKYR